MITIVRFTNTKTIYTVVTDCHSRVIASILVNPAPCMNPHHLLRWLMRRLACGTFRSDLPLLPEGDKMCLNKDEVRPILARARVVHVHPRPPPVAPGADHVLEPDVQISMIIILMIRIFESKKLWGWIAPTTSIFWPLMQLNVAHFSSFQIPSFHLHLVILPSTPWPEQRSPRWGRLAFDSQETQTSPPWRWMSIFNSSNEKKKATIV